MTTRAGGPTRASRTRSGRVDEGALYRALSGQGSRLDQSGGRPRVSTCPDQDVANRRQPANSHVDDESAGEVGQGLPVEPAVGCGWVIVAGDERHGRGLAPVSYWQAGIGRDADACRHARDDTEGDSLGDGGVRPPPPLGRRRTGRPP